MLRKTCIQAILFLGLCGLPTLGQAEPRILASSHHGFATRGSEAESEVQAKKSIFQGLRTIVIDPGHGGDNQGAIGVARAYEKHLTLELALTLREHLEKRFPDAKVILTRTDDSNPSLSERIAMANHAQADLFMSIHFNASENLEAYGFESFWAGDFHEIESEKDGLNQELREEKRSAAVLSEILAQCFNKQMGRRFSQALDRGVKPGDFTVLTKAQVPAVVVELAFLTHAEEGKRVTRKRNKDKYVRVLLDSIIAYESQYKALQEEETL